MRNALAGFVLVFGLAAVWVLWGIKGLAGAGIGLAIFRTSLGIATGYWVGSDGRAEAMVTELMRRIKAHDH